MATIEGWMWRLGNVPHPKVCFNIRILNLYAFSYRLEGAPPELTLSGSVVVADAKDRLDPD